jgi:hypothetical protein
MKINEFEKPQLNEGFLDTLIGDGRTAGIKSMFNPGMSAKTQAEQDKFNKDFVADAIASLQNAIKSGIVIPGASAPTGSAAPAGAPSKPPFTPPKPPFMPPKGPGSSEKTDEATYYRLNAIFESIVNVNEIFGKQPQPVEGAESISSYMLDWFGQWMRGVDWNKREPQVKSLINAIETSYPKGNWKGAIQQLAKAAYSITNAGSSTPKGLQNAVTPTKAPTKTPTASKVDIWGSDTNTAREQVNAILKAHPALQKEYSGKV